MEKTKEVGHPTRLWSSMIYVGNVFEQGTITDSAKFELAKGVADSLMYPCRSWRPSSHIWLGESHLTDLCFTSLWASWRDHLVRLSIWTGESCKETQNYRSIHPKYSCTTRRIRRGLANVPKLARTFVTADTYSNGYLKVILGQAIKKLSLPRDEIVVMTKWPHGPTIQQPLNRLTVR